MSELLCDKLHFMRHLSGLLLCIGSLQSRPVFKSKSNRPIKENLLVFFFVNWSLKHTGVVPVHSVRQSAQKIIFSLFIVFWRASSLFMSVLLISC